MSHASVTCKEVVLQIYELKALLNQCTSEQRALFVRAFSPKALSTDLTTVINNLPIEKLTSAISLCQRTVDKNNTNKI